MICIGAVLCIGSHDNNLDFCDENNLTNEEFERLFKDSIREIDARNPQWITNTLRGLKRGYTTYSDNTRALSTLSLLQEASQGDNPEFCAYILSCSSYRKKDIFQQQ